MGKELELSIAKLVPQTMSRIRGQEAAGTIRELARRATASRVYLDLCADSVVTASFVDELVQQASQMEREGGPEVVFVICNDDLLAKLQKSITWRRLSCRYRLRGSQAVNILRPAETVEATPKVRTGTKSQIPATD